LRASGELVLEMLASGIEATPKFLEFRFRDDVDLEVEVSLGGFVAVD